ncbi:hypothetical protein BTA51_10350 [Hahella sp. CCB-MM4]|nr:hypothetical protein BTA51_10350 [Hahella sp. CCB-MM4]
MYERLKDRLGRHLIRHKIGGSPFFIPWDQWCFWLNRGPQNYYLDEIEPFLKTVKNEKGSVAFIDLGADIGIVSALVAESCPNISLIVAIEPNPASYQILELNASKLKVETVTSRIAISNFTGDAFFNFDESVASDHEGHLLLTEGELNASTHKTEVTTFDELFDQNSLSGYDCVVVKLDVEGQEQAFFEGAERALQSATKLIVLVELHPDVLRRENMTPEDIFQTAEKGRQFTWYVPLEGNRRIDRNRPFYEQFALHQYDVIGISA